MRCHEGVRDVSGWDDHRKLRWRLARRISSLVEDAAGGRTRWEDKKEEKERTGVARKKETSWHGEGGGNAAERYAEQLGDDLHMNSLRAGQRASSSTLTPRSLLPWHCPTSSSGFSCPRHFGHIQSFTFTTPIRSFLPSQKQSYPRMQIHDAEVKNYGKWVYYSSKSFLTWTALYQQTFGP